MITHGTNLLDKANRDVPHSITYSNALDRPATDTKMVKVEAEAGSSISQGFVDTRAARTALAPGPATKMIKNQREHSYIQRSKRGASALQPQTLAHMRPNFARTSATQPSQRLRLSGNTSRGLSHRLREYSSQSSL